MAFELLRETRLNLDDPALPRPLAEIHAYWERLRAGRAMPPRAEIDPAAIAGHLRRVHLLAVEAPACSASASTAAASPIPTWST